jgi:ribonuclease I
MLQHWPDLKKKAADNNQFIFCNHEYNRHGSYTDFIPKEYFRKALDMKKKIDMLPVLGNNQIKPVDFT